MEYLSATCPYFELSQPWVFHWIPAPAVYIITHAPQAWDPLDVPSTLPQGPLGALPTQRLLHHLRITVPDAAPTLPPPLASLERPGLPLGCTLLLFLLGSRLSPWQDRTYRTPP